MEVKQARHVLLSKLFLPGLDFWSASGGRQVPGDAIQLGIGWSTGSMV